MESVNRNQILAMWTGIGLLVCTWMFPPARLWGANSYPSYHLFHYGFSFVVDADKIQYPKLVLLDAVIAALTAGSMVTLARKR